MNLKKLTKLYLEQNGYDGLLHADTCCGCGIEDLMPCGEPSQDCEPGYAGESCECGGECNWGIFRERQFKSKKLTLEEEEFLYEGT